MSIVHFRPAIIVEKYDKEWCGIKLYKIMTRDILRLLNLLKISFKRNFFFEKKNYAFVSFNMKCVTSQIFKTTLISALRKRIYGIFPFYMHSTANVPPFPGSGKIMLFFIEEFCTFLRNATIWVTFHGKFPISWLVRVFKVRIVQLWEIVFLASKRK